MKKALKIFSFTVIAVMAFTSVSCSNDDEPEVELTLSQKYAGTYDGTITINVAGQYSYDAFITCTLKAGDNETITVSFPEYSLMGTMMGDMTLGGVTVSGLAYDESKGGFYRNFGGEGITQTMNGSSYPLNDLTSILVIKDRENEIKIEYPFTLGKMSLPLTATFVGK